MSTTDPSDRLARSVWMLLIGVRVAAALGLLLYPRLTDSPLTGWDAERFQEISTIEGRPWVDTEVEYPPGTVAIAKLIGGDNPVQTNDRLVLVSLAVDLGLAELLRRFWDKRTALVYLAVGLPLIPAGLLRLDLWAALAAVAALVALARRRRGVFALFTVVGALIKVWPVLLIGAALSRRRYSDAALAIGLGICTGLAWLVYGGTDAPAQVLSLRGATGWQIESVGGSLTGLFTDRPVTLENNAYRIGAISGPAVLIGRLLAVSAVGLAAWRRLDSATTLLIGVSAMIVTAPLLSPQFLLWLTPFVAICWPTRTAKFAALAIVLTGLVGPIFGYDRLADPVPAILLLIRDAMLVATVVAGLMTAPATEPQQFHPTRKTP